MMLFMFDAFSIIPAVQVSDTTMLMVLHLPVA